VGALRVALAARKSPTFTTGEAVGGGRVEGVGVEARFAGEGIYVGDLRRRTIRAPPTSPSPSPSPSPYPTDPICRPPCRLFCARAREDDGAAESVESAGGAGARGQTRRFIYPGARALRVYFRAFALA
jgi:hypothetical protein